MPFKGKNMKNKIEKRSIGEIRATEDAGIVEAYLTKWDTVDSWNSSFEKGSFEKTFKTRGIDNIRLIWNHDQLAGKILEVREDADGPLAKCQFNLETMAGKEAFAHVKAGDVNCFSFGFRSISDHWVKGVRSIKEVELYECGPVVFQANDEATITDVRAQDFNQTVADNEIYSRGWKLQDGLWETVSDIFWSMNTSGDIISLVDVAITDFHTAYMDWLNEYYSQFENREGPAPREIRNHILKSLELEDIEKIPNDTSLTKTEVRSLADGNILPIEAREKLKEVSEDLFNAHQIERRKKIETLCNELRAGGFSSIELDRIDALIKRQTGEDELISFLREFRNKL